MANILQFDQQSSCFKDFYPNKMEKRLKEFYKKSLQDKITKELGLWNTQLSETQFDIIVKD